jgi:hypothetical protein
LLVDAILDHELNDKVISTHIGIGTGARNNTIGHLHSDWFFYDANEDLYLQIPSYEECKIGNGNGTCGSCEDDGGYSPKTPAGQGRQILIKNSWTNHANDEQKERFGLRDHVESYFALDGKNAPDGVQHGMNLIKGNGVSAGPLGNWVREIAAKSAIQPQMRRRQLLEAGVDEEDIRDFGTDSEGRAIPDIMPHDLRACYCTQLMRNEVPPSKAINKTGHKFPSTLSTYVMFAANEIDAEEEKHWY